MRSGLSSSEHKIEPVQDVLLRTLFDILNAVVEKDCIHRPTNGLIVREQRLREQERVAV